MLQTRKVLITLFLRLLFLTFQSFMKRCSRVLLLRNNTLTRFADILLTILHEYEQLLSSDVSPATKCIALRFPSKF